MNKLYILVKIEEIKYNFLPKNKKNEVCNIKGMLSNDSNVKLLAYDKIADKCYKILKENKVILVEGILNSEMKIEILQFQLCF